MRRNKLFGWMAGFASIAMAAGTSMAPVLAAVSENSPVGNSEPVEEVVGEEDKNPDAAGQEEPTEADVGREDGAKEGREGAASAAPQADIEAEGSLDRIDGASARGANSGGKDTEASGVYDFKDNKTTGTVTVVEKWDDQSNNAERPVVDVSLSTAKPSKSALGYTVTFHGNKAAGLVFNDGRDINEVVYNSSGQIVDGVFKVPGGWAAGAVSWFTDKKLKNKVDVSEDGTVQMPLSGDIDLWGKVKTFKIKGGYYRRYSTDIGGNGFNDLIPDTVTEIFFTDEIKPENASVIDVDADGDGGVIAWTENSDTIMKVSTQIKGMKVQAAELSGYMFYDCRGLTALDLSSLDTQNATNMFGMFRDCSGLTALDLSPLNTQKVTNMANMFYGCSGLTALDLSPLDTQNVTDMSYMFFSCHGLAALDLSPFDTHNVTYMGSMFRDCSSLTALDLSSFDTSNVKNMLQMFEDCSGLTALDLSSFNTQKVTNMNSIFADCSGLTALDLSSFDTQNVTDMNYMFQGCRGLTALDLSPLNTQKVMEMSYMFQGCSGLTALDLSPLNTQNVNDMRYMFSKCSGLTALDLSPLNTQNVMKMSYMFQGCRGLTSIITGPNFKFVGIDYRLAGTWRNTAGETFTSGKFPSNVADTYTKIAS